MRIRNGGLQGILEPIRHMIVTIVMQPETTMEKAVVHQKSLNIRKETHYHGTGDLAWSKNRFFACIERGLLTGEKAPVSRQCSIFVSSG